MRGSYSNPRISIYIFYANFFRNTKAVGFPRFKSRKDRQNFHCPQHCRVNFSNDKDTQGKRHTDLKLYHTLFVSRPLCDPCRFINSNSGVHYVDNSGHHYFLQEYENLFTLNPAHTFISVYRTCFPKINRLHFTNGIDGAMRTLQYVSPIQSREFGIRIA